MRILPFIALLFSFQVLTAQEEAISLELNTSADTIFFGNAFKVEYKILNGRFGDFNSPDLRSFDLLAGPNRASSLSIINGVRYSEETISNYYRPQKTGIFEIPEISLEIEGHTYQSTTKTIMVVENPDNLQQNPNTGQVEGRPTVKKKVRKRYKI